MKKVISYRQKLIELARIYRIDRILDTNLKLTTYEIELELLKKKYLYLQEEVIFLTKLLMKF